MSSIFKRTWKTKAGELRTAWRVQFYVDRRAKNRDFPTERRAKKFQDQVETATAKVLRDDKAAKGPSIAQLARDWLEACRVGRGERPPLEPATVVRYRGIVDQYIIPQLGHLRVGNVTPAHVREFRRYVLQDTALARASAKKVVTALRTLFGYAIDEDHLLTIDPTNRLRVQMSSRDRPDVQIHSKAEMSAILTAAARLRVSTNRQTARTWERYEPLLLILVYAGLRLSEVRGLMRDAVDVAVGTITVRQRADNRGRIGPPKTKQGRRRIHIPDDTTAALKAWLATHEHPLVFATRSGLPIGGDNVRKRMWTTVQEEAQVRVLTLHSARHFFASREIERGTNLKELCDLMGHADEAFTLRTYGHLFRDKDTERKRRQSANDRVLAPA